MTELSKLLCKRMNNITIVGQELGLNEDFIKFAARYVEDAALVGELLGICPKFLKPYVGLPRQTELSSPLTFQQPIRKTWHEDIEC